MKLKTGLLCLFAIATLALSAQAQAQAKVQSAPQEPSSNIMDELDPYDPNIDQILNLMDQVYESETGLSAHVNNDFINLLHNAATSNCYRMTCKVYALVVKAEQQLYLYVDGKLEATWPVSTGTPGHGTPDFDKNPNGRIYTRYSSRKYPGGDYEGLGNMPYAVFIEGGFAIHGTGRGNWSKLGRRASHGCIRLHPDNAKIFNSLVRENGIYNTWITVQ